MKETKRRTIQLKNIEEKKEHKKQPECQNDRLIKFNFFFATVAVIIAVVEMYLVYELFYSFKRILYFEVSYSP